MVGPVTPSGHSPVVAYSLPHNAGDPDADSRRDDQITQDHDVFSEREVASIPMIISDKILTPETRQELANGTLSEKTLVHLAKILDETEIIEQMRNQDVMVLKMQTTVDESGERMVRPLKHFGSINTMSMIAHRGGVLRLALAENGLVYVINERDPLFVQRALAEICSQMEGLPKMSPGLLKIKRPMFDKIKFIDGRNIRDYATEVSFK